jgi:AcrR family transcriptional regulator
MPRPVKHRRATDSGYARGDETRARIVVTALKLFGEHGFDGASTRDIATAAGVNAPALQYYFDSKEGLFTACVEHIVDRIWEQLGGALAQAEAVLKADGDDESLMEALCSIHACMLEFMFNSPDAADWKLFMARIQLGGGPPAGFEIFYQRVHQRMRSVMAEIVGRLLGLPGDDDEVLIRTFVLNGQLSAFQMIRRSALAALKWDSVDLARLSLIQRIIREQTLAVLRSLTVMRDSRSTAPTRRGRHPGGRASAAKRASRHPGRGRDR